MPQSVAPLTFALLVIGLLLAASTYITRRFGMETEIDPLVALWRRWGALGRLPELRSRAHRRGTQALRKPASKPRSKPAPVRAKPMTRAKAAGSPRGDVPLSDDVAMGSEKGESKRALRQRFRSGLRKTREKFTRDVREVFGSSATDEGFDRLEEALVAADVGVGIATSITDDLRRKRAELTAQTMQPSLKEAMIAHLAASDRSLRLSRDKTSVWVVCGVNGTGKTTSIAKLAARAKSVGVKTILAAADTFRAAAAEQLDEWGSRVGVDVVRQKTGADPGAVVFDAIARANAQGANLVIVDTAGRLHTRKPLMDELKKVLRVIDREDAALTECLLVIDATTGQNGIAQAKAFKEAAGVTGLVLAKLDGTAKGGIAFAVEKELGVPVKAVGTGEQFKDLVPFEPDVFVDALLGDD